MHRTRTTWMIFTGALIAAAVVVSWLSMNVLTSERLTRQMQQQALFDSKARVALWRLDAVAAPLLALESAQSKFLPTNDDLPKLSQRLVKGRAIRDAAGRWTVTPTAATFDSQSLTAALSASDWWVSLADPISGPNSSESSNVDDGLLVANVLTEYVEWPPSTPSSVNQKNFTQQAATIAPTNNLMRQKAGSPDDAAARQQLVGQVSQLAVSPANQVTQQVVTPKTNQQRHAVVGPYVSLWLGNELLLARKVRWTTHDRFEIECRVLDWDQWQALLKKQISDTLPDAMLAPRPAVVKSTTEQTLPEWQMVSLPIGFESQVITVSNAWPQSLVIAWVMLIVVAVALSLLLWKTQQLSERRAAFVSAVTHELRTPLTTFRLYTEMLSEGLVPDPEQQKTYFQTLASEANRLTHLVENVLSFARLERGRGTVKNESLTVRALLERCESRLVKRVSQTALQWHCDMEESTRDVVLQTNATAIEQILFNLVDNACKYASNAADPRVEVATKRLGNRILITVSDFGPGLSVAARKNLFRAFEKSSTQAADSAPGIGLGLSLSRRLARDLGGDLRLTEACSGTQFELSLSVPD